jgi:hypothetical protein
MPKCWAAGDFQPQMSDFFFLQINPLAKQTGGQFANQTQPGNA